MKRPILFFLALVLLAAVLGGCVTLPDPEVSQEFSGDAIGTIDGAHTVGQTFASRRPRLNGVELWLTNPAPAPSGPGALVVELFHDPPEATPLASTTLAVESLPADHLVRVILAPQDDPPDQRYHLQLRTVEGAVTVLGRNEDAYPGGEALVDGAPIEADIAFRLLYDYDAAAMLGDLLDLLPRLWLALPLAALLLLPGWLLLDLSRLRGQFDGGEQAALAAGLSIALTPLLLLWTTILGLRWSRPAVIAGAALLAAIAAWRLIRHLIQRKNPPSSFIPHPSSCTLAAIFVLSLAVRLAMVRDLAVPAWVDPVHHALITQLIVDEGALPAGYEPFMDIGTASYHTGFHSLVAAFHWLSGLDVARAMLLLGQVLNALQVVAAYLLAREMTADRTTGLIAALIVGLISPMPAYYASWGRYTQLAGLLILPAALVLARRALHPPAREEPAETRKLRIRYLVPAVAALGGLILTHYRVAAFYGCFLLAYLIGERYSRGAGWRRLADDGLWLGAIGGGATILTLPWLAPAWTTLWLPKLQAWSGVRSPAFFDFSWRYLVPGLGKYVLAAAVVGLGWALLQRQRFAVTLAAWIGLLFVLPSLAVWGLPGGGFVNYTSVEIALFLPLSILGGYFVSQVLAAWELALPPRWMGVYRSVVTVMIGGLALYGAWVMLPILNVDTVLFRQADEPAMAWIRDNTPADARFLINPMPWLPYACAGHDGGYWLSPLAGRPTIPPPALYGLGPSDNTIAIHDLCTEVGEAGKDPEVLWPLLGEQGITHVYIGARGGVLSARALDDSELYRRVYSRNGTRVFELVGSAP